MNFRFYYANQWICEHCDTLLVRLFLQFQRSIELIAMQSDEIKREDCPTELALAYPGQWTRNNKVGSTLSRNQWVNQETEKWVRHFNGSKKYENTCKSNKVRYLVIFLKCLKVKAKEASECLDEIEHKIANERLQANVEVMDEVNVSDSLDENEEDIENIKLLAKRAKIEMDVQKLMKGTDEELFEKNENILGYVKRSHRYQEREKKYYLEMTEEQLFGRFELLPKRIKEMNEFKERHRLHAAKYISENLKNKSDYEILQAIGNTPASVLNSEEYKAKISHLTFKERSSIVLKSTISEVLTELKKTPGGRKQYKLVLAALSHPVYGPPELDMAIHTRDIKKAKETRTQLFEGREPILKVEENKYTQRKWKTWEDNTG